ncbi:MAG: chemotaxis protein CheD [Rhodobacterales bacterium CG_4_10_14_0_8_um_filter_70_9]|nr:MAG: chemotaxis protein CheD [Rhodobacterales bacterium CG_4_10_14_0_8_um_filter_70_9]PJA59645.1 MAG: chemotaxis protein CheD [Rhodobacterales bacterium CG_4_9_14_3_um_filter_71_31]
MQPAALSQRITVIQGEWVVSRDPEMVLTTVLGSCVAACIRDPQAGVGGMNHFLLPDGGEAAKRGEAERYGVHLMELLVNGLLKQGARRDRLEAKLFGGCAFMSGRYAVGARNVAFAEKFLRDEGIAYLGGSVGGAQGRRIEYWPASGRARQIMLQADAPPPPPPPPAPRAPVGEVELF